MTDNFESIAIQLERAVAMASLENVIASRVRMHKKRSHIIRWRALAVAGQIAEAA